MPKHTNKASTNSHQYGEFNMDQQQQHRGPLIATGRQFAYRSDPRVTMRQQQKYPTDLDDMDYEAHSPLQLQQSQETNDFPSFINAPTSLTNLAQLSGISLVPVSSGQRSKGQVANNPIRQHTIDQMNANLQRPKQSSIGNHPDRWHVPVEEFNDPQESVITIPGPANIPSSFNLTAIPSIRLLNQASLESNQWKTSNNASNTKSTKKPQQPKTYINNACNKGKHDHVANKVTEPSVSTDLTPTNGDLGSQAFSASSASSLTNTIKPNNSLSNIFSMAPELFSDQQRNEPGQDPNAVDLMKLMAIFNNPALTITPVTSSISGHGLVNGYDNNDVNLATDNLQQVTSTDLVNIRNRMSLESKNTTKRTGFHQALEKNFNIQRGLQRGELQRRSIPRSTANIQVLYGNHANDTSHCPQQEGVSLDIAESVQINNQNHHGGDTSWLSNYSNFAKPEAMESSATSTPRIMTESNLGHSSGMMSLAARNFIMEQPASGSSNLPTVSVELLKHIASQTRDNIDHQDAIAPINNQSIYEPECILSVARCTVQQLCKLAKYEMKSHIVTSDYSYEKNRIGPIQTTKNRLYIPRAERHANNNKLASSTPFNLNSIRIETEDSREMLVSDRHFMLERMMLDENPADGHHNNIPEPDDIFVNRSKRIMSKIDTDVERRKRRRFEQISRRCENKDIVAYDSDDESEDLLQSVDTISSKFLPIQLPLEEELSDEKRTHLSSVGLVSRDERNKIMIEQSERKAELYSQLPPTELHQDIIEDARRFVDMMLKTGGGPETQLRIDSSIKRSDLPLIEGLNRNSSRVKMTFMSVLGLEKKSKRTTLYKVKQSENSSPQVTIPSQVQPQLQAPQQQQQQQIMPPQQQQPDLNNKANVDIITKQQFNKLTPYQPIKQNGNSRPIPNGNQILQAAIMSCREALKIPSKDEYMKSLGLIDITS